MLRTQIDLWPHGSEQGKKNIFDCCIANVGKGKEGFTYVYYGRSDRDEVKQGKVYNHNREDGVFKLMQRVYEMIEMGEKTMHFFTEYELRVIEQMKKRIDEEVKV